MIVPGFVLAPAPAIAGAAKLTAAGFGVFRLPGW